MRQNPEDGGAENQPGNYKQGCQLPESLFGSWTPFPPQNPSVVYFEMLNIYILRKMEQLTPDFLIPCAAK